MYHIYVLKSKKDNSIYLDYTTEDIQQRLKAHNQGLIKFTSQHRPWSLVYCRSSESLSEATYKARRFRFIRRPFKNIKNIKNRIRNKLSRRGVRSLLLPKMSFVERYLITKGQ